jgi:hypothetical protein
MADIVVAEYGQFVANEAMNKCLEMSGSICNYQEIFIYGILIGFTLGIVTHRIGRLINGRLQIKR